MRLAIKTLLELMKPKRRMYLLGLLISTFSIIIALIPPKIIGDLIDEGIINGNKGVILHLLILAFSLIVIKTVSRYFMVICFEHSTQHMIINLRKKLFYNLQHLDNTYYSSNTAGDLMARLTGDIDMVRHFFSYVLFVSFEAVIQFVFTFVYLLTINVPLTLILMTCAPFIVVLNFRMFKQLRSVHVRTREAYSKLNTATKENIDGNRTVKAFVREDYEIEKMGKRNDEMRDINILGNRTWLKFGVPVDFFSALLGGIALIAGAYFVVKGQLTIGGLSVFTGLLWAIANPLRMSGPLINDYQRVVASIEKIMPLYFVSPLIKDKEDAVTAERFRDTIVFDNVSLSLGTTEILKDINLTIHAGETVAIMGPTGSGKTMLINLLLRMYDVSSGEIKLDGIDIRNLTVESLRKTYGVSAQDVFLFSNTIEGNIAFSDPEMDSEKTHKYAKMAQAEKFIKQTPNGYETIIGEMGVGLSGGQKQRLSLARALAAEAPVLILDDTTSAVDMETEKSIQNELSKLSCTKIIIAQRITSVFKADKIVIVENGRITQCGTHQELKNQPGYYKSVLEIQHPSESREKEAVLLG